MTQRDHWNVEFLNRLTKANGTFQAKIREFVPNDMTLRNRAYQLEEVGPGHSGYDLVHRRFKAEVSDANSITILNWLYQFDVIFKENIELFRRKYIHNFIDRPGQWAEILSDHPRIYQTTICYLLTGKNSDTLVSYRLEDLERIGLVVRSDARPPKPKHVNITSAGRRVLEAAIAEAHASLGPMTASDMALPPMKSPQPCTSAKAAEPSVPLEANEPAPSEQLVDKPK